MCVVLVWFVLLNFGVLCCVCVSLCRDGLLFVLMHGVCVLCVCFVCAVYCIGVYV